MTINVQIPVVDDASRRRRAACDGSTSRAGIQHMTGAEALLYARSRHTLERLRPRRAPAARPDRRSASRPIRRRSSRGCPSSSTRSRRRSGPTSRSTSWRSCSGSPRRSTRRTSGRTCSRRRSTRRSTCRARAATSSSRTSSKIRAAVKRRVHDRPGRRGASARSSPRRAPRSGSSTARATAAAGRDVAGYLEYHGLAASAPRQKPPGAVPANTTIVVYNGAEATLPDTIAYLEQTFGVKVDRGDRPGDPRPTSSSRSGSSTPEPRAAARP